jgi:hypothetical protein
MLEAYVAQHQRLIIRRPTNPNSKDTWRPPEFF